MAQTLNQGGVNHYQVVSSGNSRFYAVELAPWTALVLIALAGLIRLSLINQSVWYDEAFTYWLAGLPLGKLIEATAGDVHPPLYYLLAWGAAQVFGLSFWSIRLPALLFGLLSLILVAAILRHWQLPAFVKSASLLMTVISPFLVYYSVEARMYSLLLFCVLLTILAALRRSWPLFGLAIGLGMLTHNLMILYLIPLAALWFISGGRWPVLRAFALALAIYAVWLPTALRQAISVKNAFWVQPLSPGRVVGAVYEATAEVATNSHTLVPAAILVLILLGVGTMQAVKAGHWPVLLLAWGPPAVGVIVSLAYRPMLMSPPRILIGATPFLLILAVWGFYRLKTDVGGWAIPLAGGVTVAALFLNLYISPSRLNYRAIYSTLAIEAEDSCYHLTPASIVLVDAYVDCNHYVWPRANNLEQSLTSPTKGAMGMDRRPFEAVPGATVWLFHSDGPFSSPAEFVERERILGANPGPKIHLFSEQDILESSVWKLEK